MMMRKVLVVAFACLSVAAVAQSSAGADQNAKPAENTRDAASGQATGKRMHKPMSVSADADLDASSKDAAKSKTASGGKSATDDWSASTAKKDGSSSGQAGAHVAAGDVNGDGRADLTTTKNSGHATEQNAIASPRDVASGQASGKRQHQPISPSAQDSSSTSSSSKKDNK